MFVNQSLQIGGAERQIFNLAKGFTQLKNMEISIFLLKKEGGFAKNLDAEIQARMAYSDVNFTERWPLKSILRTVSVIRAVKRFRPDIIYARVMSIHCCLAGKILGIPVVIGEINNPSKSVEKIRPALLRLQTFLVRKTSRRLATHIVANSSGLADGAKKYWKLKSRPSVIHNGLDIEFIERESGEPSGCSWIDDKKTPLVVSTGRIVPAKGFANLIDAFAIVKKSTEARLMIIGGRSQDGEKDRLLKKVAGLGLGDCILFVGEKTNPYPFMKVADTYVSSSLYEGFSNSLLEALALGVPVVSTDHDFGANEIIQNGQNGFLVPVADPEAMAEAILRILKNRELGENLSSNARAKAQNFTIEKTVSEYEKLFQNIVESSTYRTS